MNRLNRGFAMKTIFIILTITIFINPQTNAQRNTNSGGRGQESERTDRIHRIQDTKSTTDNHPGKIESPPKNPVIERPLRPPKRKKGVPIEGDYCNNCPQITPTCKVILDNDYILSNEVLAIQCIESGDLSGAILNLNIAISHYPLNSNLYVLRGKV